MHHQVVACGLAGRSKCLLMKVLKSSKLQTPSLSTSTNSITTFMSSLDNCAGARVSDLVPAEFRGCSFMCNEVAHWSNIWEL